MNNSDLYNVLTRFGQHYPLQLQNPVGSIVKDLDREFDWVRYNPRTNIDREALSITSLDGGLSGIPDLDSLIQYSKETGTYVPEEDIITKTEVYPYFKQWLDPIQEHICRTHIIRLNNGGYFPMHRDCRFRDINSFRLFLPMTYNSGTNFFMLENTKLEFTKGQVSFIDTCKMHTVFNASEAPWYFVVINVMLNTESVDKILTYLYG
jgi:hypothetical protein